MNNYILYLLNTMINCLGRSTLFDLYIVSFSTSLMFWNPHTSFFKSLFPLSSNFGLTFTGHSSSFSISHTKYIISLYSAIKSTIVWNWLSEFLHMFLWIRVFYTIEASSSFINSLSWCWWFWFSKSFSIPCLFTSVSSLFS